jgi:hypothetical protein
MTQPNGTKRPLIPILNTSPMGNPWQEGFVEDLHTFQVQAPARPTEPEKHLPGVRGGDLGPPKRT